MFLERLEQGNGGGKKRERRMSTAAATSATSAASTFDNNPYHPPRRRPLSASIASFASPQKKGILKHSKTNSMAQSRVGFADVATTTRMRRPVTEARAFGEQHALPDMTLAEESIHSSGSNDVNGGNNEIVANVTEARDMPITSTQHSYEYEYEYDQNNDDDDDEQGDARNVFGLLNKFYETGRLKREEEEEV